jgi:hypothetical protein
MKSLGDKRLSSVAGLRRIPSALYESLGCGPVRLARTRAGASR